MSPTERLEQEFIEEALDHEVVGKRAGRDSRARAELDRKAES